MILFYFLFDYLNSKKTGVKTITLNCPDVACKKLAYALEQYADAAYPPGASECSQASRAAILDAVASINLQCATKTGAVSVSRRLRSNIKAALRYAAENEQADPVYELLTREISGIAVNQADWDKLA